MLSHSPEHAVVICKCVTTSCLFSQFFFTPKNTLISSKQGTTTGLQAFVCNYLSSKAVQQGYIKNMKSKLIGFLMNFWISFSLALYFHIGEREEKCIIEDIPSDTLVVGRYLSMLYDDLTQAITKITENVIFVIDEYGKKQKRAHWKYLPAAVIRLKFLKHCVYPSHKEMQAFRVLYWLNREKDCFLIVCVWNCCFHVCFCLIYPFISESL